MAGYGQGLEDACKLCSTVQIFVEEIKPLNFISSHLITNQMSLNAWDYTMKCVVHVSMSVLCFH